MSLEDLKKVCKTISSDCEGPHLLRKHDKTETAQISEVFY
jgi:hypothetical protein